MDFSSDCRKAFVVHQEAVRSHWQLRRRHHPIHDHYLLSILPAEMAFFKSNEEGPKAGAEDEGAAGEDQRNEANRSSSEGVADGATSTDEGRQSFRRLSAAVDSDAVSICSLSSNHYLARFSSGEFSMASRSFG